MIRLVRPPITFEEVEPVLREIFSSGWFTKGESVAAFREAIAREAGAGFAHLTTSATTALWTVVKLLGIGPGDEVVVSDYSFPASGNVVEDLGARPVYADVDPDTFNMRPDSLLEKISERTRAVMFVDAFGNPAGITEIESICREKDLPLIEDAACAIGSSEGGRKCGNFGEFGCFSFHPRKLITTGEGGAITGNNPRWNDWLTVKLEHGARIRDGVYDFVEYGYNFRMSEIQAAMGLVQLQKLDAILEKRIRMRQQFVDRLAPLGFRAQWHPPEVVHNVQSLVFKVPEGTDRDRLALDLRIHGIESTLGTYSLSATTYYRKKYEDVQPVGAKLQQTTLTLPCHDEVDVDFVTETLAGVMERS